MSLTFTGSDTDVVNYGTAASIDDWIVFTSLAWVFPTASITANTGSFFTKTPGNALTGKSFFTGVSVANPNRLRCQIDRATADAEASSSNNTLVTSAWNFVGVTYGETNGPKLFKGSLTATVVETGYAVGPTIGSGATGTDDPADLVVGNRNPLNVVGSFSFPGAIACFAYINKELTLQQIITCQFDFRNCIQADGTCKLLSYLGDNGTGTQPDYSGNGNNGTVTGAIQSNNVPLRPKWGYDSSAVVSTRIKRMLASLGVGK